MSEPTDAAIDAALERGRAARLNEPRAAAARYDRERDRVIVELSNGCSFAFPPRLAEGLRDATADQLGEVQVPRGGIRPALGSSRCRSLGAGFARRPVRDQKLHGPPRRPGELRGQGRRGACERRQGRTPAQVGLIGFCGGV